LSQNYLPPRDDEPRDELPDELLWLELLPLLLRPDDDEPLLTDEEERPLDEDEPLLYDEPLLLEEVEVLGRDTEEELLSLLPLLYELLLLLLGRELVPLPVVLLLVLLR
jgi:hypothetical protein